ncbi:MAG: acyclic terpene utilization AtuA family protein [Comamonas sp.]
MADLWLHALSQPVDERPNLLIGCGAGFSGDRTDAARAVVDTLIASKQPSVLMFETLAERTLALAQLAKDKDPTKGYEPLLEAMLEPVLADCLENGIRIVSNFGAANPAGAAQCIQQLAKRLGAKLPRIAVVSGDDVMTDVHLPLLQQACGAEWPSVQVVSANAYIGAQPIAQALLAGADIVVTGRVADPSLALGPAAAYYGWHWDEWDKLARATMAGHLLECGSQVSGGYFADPGFKDVPDLANVGFPIAEIDREGACTVTKAANTGGCVSAQTVKEQLLYEVHDPAAYLTPDVVADISQAQVIELGHDKVRLEGVKGHPRPTSLKVNVCATAGWLAEAEISYAGAHALRRAQLADQVIQQRIGHLSPIRTDFIGLVSVLGNDTSIWKQDQHTLSADARDVRVRWAWECPTNTEAQLLGREVNALYTCGPAGGGGVRATVRSRLNTVSCLIEQHHVLAGWSWAKENDLTGEVHA